MSIVKEIEKDLEEQIKNVLLNIRAKISTSENFSDTEKRILKFILIESLNNNQHLIIFKNILK